jgi:hypothetical protein
MGCELHTRAALFSQRSTCSIAENAISDEGAQRAFAESIAANPDIALVDLEGVDLSPYVDVLGVSDELRGTVRSSRTYKRNESRSSE